MKKWFSKIGPGTMVMAAFIGPGTVTVCTIAGVKFGYSLLWALILSIITCSILQEMAARLGLVTQKGLSEVLKSQLHNRVLRGLFIGIIIAAIFVGNAAYEAGNISGGALGLSMLIDSQGENNANLSFNYVSLIIGSLAFLLLYLGNYKIIERALMVLVLCMSLAFMAVAIATRPDISQIFGGLLPDFSSDKLFTVIALVGTTVVPYNLFLHASIVKEKWKESEDLPAVRRDTYVTILIGGIVSMAIIIAGAAVKDIEVNNAADLAKSLEPIFGTASKYVLSIGLFAAGITSAITAPLAAAYVVNGCMGWKANLKSRNFRSVWMIILFLGILFSSIGLKPIRIIQFAQVANGILLPVVAVFLLWIMNKRVLLGNHINSWKQNTIGIIVILIAFFLGVRSISKALGYL